MNDWVAIYTNIRRAAAWRWWWAWLVFTAAAAQAQIADPWVNWKTADSAHFRVHYRAAHRVQAEAVARAAERAWPKITSALQWQPAGRVEIAVYSEMDLSNGFSTPLPFNLIGVFLAPPDEGELLENSAWLDLLLVHEFTHAVHLDKMRGAPRVLRTLFGRMPLWFPNIFNPVWAIEGLAVYEESDAAAGRGRLHGPMFEAWLRAERAQGFVSLAELNANGRALPLSKQYLYGAYFYEFLARRHGAQAPRGFVERYSGNIVPRLNSNPVRLTGKKMGPLWEEFLTDLAAQVDAMPASIGAKREPEVLGERLAGPLFDISSVATLPDGAVLAVLDDGLHRAQLVRVSPDGRQRTLADVNTPARISVASDGRVLVAQPDLCNTHYLSFDLYALRDGGGLRQLTYCAHLRRAVHAGSGIVALQLDAGNTRLVALDAQGRNLRVLHEAPPGTDLIDVAADGRAVSFISRREGHWSLLQLDIDDPAAVRTLARRTAPMTELRQGARGLEVLMVEAGVYNVWRLEGETWQRLTQSDTAVVAQGGSASDGSLATASIVHGGYELRRLPGAGALQSLAVDASPSPPEIAMPVAPLLGEASSYAGWRSLYPRWWLPLATADHGLTSFGVTTAGSDALGFHQYATTLAFETSQQEPVGSLEYLFLGRHLLALSRTLEARAWTGPKDDQDTTLFDRRSIAQVLSMATWPRLTRRLTLGIGAAADHIERVDIPGETKVHRRDERLAAALVDYDTRTGNWYSEGANHGLRATLLYETGAPFASGTADDAPDYDGSILRTDLRLYTAVGRSALALRWTHVNAHGNTRPFQLGGASDLQLQLGHALASRTLSLRGYAGDEPQLRGSNASVGSVELRMPLIDIDRHAMAPPVGIGRLSATVLFDIGGAWNEGRRPEEYWRSVGVELLGELKVFYAAGLQLRAGVARGLDGPRETQGYLTLGRAF
jgi:hypothetical protein